MSSVAVGITEPEPGPEPKRSRLLDAGGPIEDDETARRKMRRAKVYEIGADEFQSEYSGFDPDNVGDIKKLHLHVDAAYTRHNITVRNDPV